MRPSLPNDKAKFWRIGSKPTLDTICGGVHMRCNKHRLFVVISCLLGFEQQRWQLLPIFALVSCLPLGFSPASAAQLPITSLVVECFRSGRLEPCQRALLRAEALQRSAAAQDNYSCQTLLLGLQADLIMTQLQAGRGDDALAMLDEVNKGCQGL
ncbi:MAG: hypothetical protein QF862_00805 [Prochlorococcaceae cyanobacterium ETNP7_MAG_30]|jgi:hypothetical protein|nr:hypothetical protein [Prochlorococcaceae cyanobacterium ETNP7_MAG_30]